MILITSEKLGDYPQRSHSLIDCPCCRSTVGLLQYLSRLSLSSPAASPPVPKPRPFGLAIVVSAEEPMARWDCRSFPQPAARHSLSSSASLNHLLLSSYMPVSRYCDCDLENSSDSEFSPRGLPSFEWWRNFQTSHFSLRGLPYGPLAPTWRKTRPAGSSRLASSAMSVQAVPRSHRISLCLLGPVRLRLCGDLAAVKQ